LGERPSTNQVSEADEPRKLPVGAQKTVEPFGLTLSELTPQLAPNYGTQIGKGVVVKNINPASFIADVKASNGAVALSRGDLIQRINRLPVADLKTFNETALKLKTGDAVVLHVVSPLERGAQMRIVQFTVQ
jgi:S1-C subfamily serine protease